MSKIVAIGTAVPPYTLTQSQAKEFAYELFHDSYSEIEKMMSVFENTNIKKRYISCPIDWYYKKHSFMERNKIYIKMACNLAEDAIRQCLDRANVHPKAIDHIIVVSTTGISTPSIDAFLINQLGLSHHIKRTPIWGLGCAGGVSGLARAHEYIKAYPASRVLFVAIELCSLTFRPQDVTKSNIVAASLFGDGAAAVLLEGKDVRAEITGPTVMDSMSSIWPHSLDVMGWEVVADGLKVVFSRDIPNMVEQNVKTVVEDFLRRWKMSTDHISYMVSHPGGVKVLQAYESALQLAKEKFVFSYDVLANFGNMSSVTVLFVLQQILQTGVNTGYGLMTALGPGFSSELMLLDWNGEK